MAQFGFLETLMALLAGTLSAVGLLMLWIRFNSSNAITARTLMREAEGSITFLFDDETLIDATPPARDLMAHRDDQRTDWDNFLTLLAARFPRLRSQCRDLARVGRKTIKPSDDQAGWIEAEYWNGLARITLVQTRNSPDETIDPLTAAAMEHELETLRSIGEDSPQLIWKRDAEGVLIWANRAYIELSETLRPPGENEILPWPPRDIFSNIAIPAGTAPIIDMHQIDLLDHDRPVSYEVTSLRRSTDTIHFAVDSTAVVAAQDAQRSFVQTLTKTFAQLSVGLAIFDADRRLVMFNPALTDLTCLPADFLIARPTLASFLDRLRDQQMIPEPKNYTTWRDQMAALETAAVEGSYHETWPLANGQTFRVTGKPHPKGSIAFLMEDISDAVSLTRKFRSQIDVTAAVLDNVDAAIAVFSSTGSLVMVNSAYRSLWGTQNEGSLESGDFRDELTNWQAASTPSPVWVKLQETLARGSTQTAWNGSVRLDSHTEMTCHYASLPDGNHQITFTPSQHTLAETGSVESLEFEPARTASV